MARDFDITGTEEFVRAARQLNAAGRQGRGLWKELNAQIKQAVEPMTEAVRQDMTTYLPDRYVQDMKPGFQVRTSRSTRGASAGLKLIGIAKGVRRRRHLKTINQGQLKHKVFGNPNNWVTQRVRPGFWTEPLKEARAIPAKHIRRAVLNTVNKLKG